MKLGEMITERYKIVGILGQGGTSTVFLAENITLNNFWAIKALSKSNQWLSVELDEINILKGLNHPMLPRIADLLEDDENYYIVMDYITGTNLLDLLHNSGNISQTTLIKWTKELLDALEYLHERTPPIIYRDLKPGNLIADNSGRLRIVDFGSARFHNQEASNDTVYIGTRGYAAPEQYGSGQSDSRTDLFNLGMTLFHLATGTHPVKISQKKMKTELKQAGITTSYINFILKLIEENPDERYQSCEEALAGLNRITNPKKIFLRKSAKKDFKGFKGVIGIASILPASGVTSFCLLLGRFLSKNGIKTALVELNPSGDFGRLRDVFDWMGKLKIQSQTRFETKDLILYPNASDFSEIPRKGVDAVILDLGHLSTEKKIRELNRADIRLVICPGAPWKFDLIPEWTKKNQIINDNEWIYLTSNSQDFGKHTVKKLIGRDPLVFYSFSPDAFNYDDEEQIRLSQTFKEICKIAGYN